MVDGEPPASTSRRSSGGLALRPRVLVIDDEPLLGQTLQLGLEESLDVELELTGARGLARLLEGELFQLVLCDLSLPDLDGIEIYERIAAERPGILPHFVVMTGGAMTHAARHFLDTYQGPLLQKPFTLHEVEVLAARFAPADG